MRSTHPIGLELLPDPRIRVERINSIELKLDLTIILKITKYIKLKFNNIRHKIISKTLKIY